MIFPSFYAGNISYYHHYLKASQPYMDVWEHFIKQSYRTRCHLTGPQGFFSLNIPVFWSSKMSMQQIEIDDSKNWRSVHLKSLDAAYNHSAFYEYYRPELKLVLENKQISHLPSFNSQLHRWILDCLDQKTELKFTEKFHSYEENDLRLSISPKKEDGISFKKYFQVYSDRHPFHPNLSVLDLLFNKGPESILYLKNPFG